MTVQKHLLQNDQSHMEGKSGVFPYLKYTNPNSDNIYFKYTKKLSIVYEYINSKYTVEHQTAGQSLNIWGI